MTPWGPPRLQAADLCPCLFSLCLSASMSPAVSLSMSASVSLSGQSHFEEFGCGVPRGAGLDEGAEDGVWRSRRGGSPCLCAVPLVLAKGRSSGRTHLACLLPLGWRQLGCRWLMSSMVALYPACGSSGSRHVLRALVHQGTLLASGDLRHPGAGYIISGHLCPSEAQREPACPDEIGRQRTQESVSPQARGEQERRQVGSQLSRNRIW